MELLLDRGADLEAKHEVSEAAVNIAAQQAAPGIAGGPGRGIGDYALRCRVPVAYRRVMRRWRWGTVGRGGMVRRGAVTCGPAISQCGNTALVRAVSGGQKDTVELLLDRGADLEAEGWVRAACRVLLRDWPRWASRVGGCNGDDDSLGRGAPVAGRRGRRRWWRGMPVGEWRCDAVM